MRYVTPLLFCMLFFLSACAATQVALEKKDLNVQTLMSDTIFLDLDEQTGRNVYVDIRNTSDKDVQLYSVILNRLYERGYREASSPKSADYVLQVNVLSVGMTDVAAIRKSTGAGFGGAALGALAGGLIGHRNTGYSPYGTTTGLIVGGLIGAGAEILADSLVKDVTYAIITDVQISAKTSGSVREENVSSHSTGRGSTRTQVGQKNSKRQKYQTRISSYANKVNLKYEEARYALEDGIARAISGIF